jgi:hypothetical protein
MAASQRTPEQESYRQGLTPKQRKYFDNLVKAIASPNTGLGWYHQVGRSATTLKASITRSQRGSGWKELAEALGCSKELLQKAIRFTELYPDEDGLSEATKLDVDWSLLSQAFSIANEEDRHNLLREAAVEGWALAKLRSKMKKRDLSKQAGRGGRPRNKPESHGAEGNLRQLDGLNTRWLEFHEHAWTKVKKGDWQKLVKKWPKDDLPALEQVDRGLKDMKNAIEKVVGDLTCLRVQLEERKQPPGAGARK